MNAFSRVSVWLGVAIMTGMADASPVHDDTPSLLPHLSKSTAPHEQARIHVRYNGGAIEAVRGNQAVSRISQHELLRKWIARKLFSRSVAARLIGLQHVPGYPNGNDLWGMCDIAELPRTTAAVFSWSEYGASAHPTVATVIARIEPTPVLSVTPICVLPLLDDNPTITPAPVLESFRDRAFVFQAPYLFEISSDVRSVRRFARVSNGYYALGIVHNRWLLFEGQPEWPRTHLRAIDMTTGRLLSWRRAIQSGIQDPQVTIVHGDAIIVRDATRARLRFIVPQGRWIWIATPHPQHPALTLPSKLGAGAYYGQPK